jgi:hypothetical protein
MLTSLVYILAYIHTCIHTYIQIVALETMAKLFNTESGLRYMLVNGHIQWLIQESSKVDQMLSTCALRVSSEFFIKMAEVTANSKLSPDSSRLMNLWGEANPSALTSQFLEAVMIHMSSTADATMFAGLSAISNFASSSLEALCYVAGMGSPGPEGVSRTLFAGMSSAAAATGGKTMLEAWTEMLRLKLNVQAAVIRSMAVVLLATQKLCHTEEDFAKHAQAMLLILRRVGDVKETLTINYVIQLATQPLPAPKFAAFEMFRSLACLQKGWGLDLMFGHTEFVDFIMVSTSTLSSFLIRVVVILSLSCFNFLFVPAL